MHDDLHSTFSEIAYQLAGVHKGSSAVVGDWNTDILPTSQCDPLAGCEGRDEHHFDKRMLLYSFMQDFGLQLLEPKCDHSSCDSFISSFVGFSNATRVPLGNQQGNASCLDYAISAPEFLSNGIVDWSLCLQDHAAVVYELDFNCFTHKRYKRKHWKCTDFDTFSKELFSLQYSEATAEDPRDLLGSVAKQMDRFQDSRSCAQRRIERMPFALRNAHKAFSNAATQADRSFWRSMIRRHRKQWHCEISTRKHLQLASKGKASAKAKKLHPIFGLQNGDGTIYDIDKYCKIIAQDYTRKMEGQ